MSTAVSLPTIVGMPASAEAIQNFSGNEPVKAPHEKNGAPAVGQGEQPDIPTLTMFQIADIVGTASLQNVALEANSLVVLEKLGDGADNLNQTVAGKARELCTVLEVMNTIQWITMGLTIACIPLVVVAPEVAAAAGASEAVASTVGTVVNVASATVTATTGAALGGTQIASGVVNSKLTKAQGSTTNYNQRTKQMGDTLSQDIKTENTMFVDLAEVVANNGYAQEAYRA